jgi:hypothetical protein
LVAGSAQAGFAQQPLNIFKNYFVTGDYVVAGWVENSSANGLATGTISIPDCTQIIAMGQVCSPQLPPPVPVGADIVAAYLYWGTVEGSKSSFAGQQAFFNGHQIVGAVLGNPNAPTSWSSGGCSGASAGSKTMRMYRTDVRPYLPRNGDRTSPMFGAIDLTNANITVQLADSGTNGNTQPFALGATLLVIYRVLSPQMPLNAIVLYDGSFAPSNTQPTITQKLVGFYQPAAAPTAKITQIVANGQSNKGENVYFGSSQPPVNQLLSLYGANPPFPGVYGVWDNPTWSVGQYVNANVPGFDTQEIISVSPASPNKGCVNWGAMILSTTVPDSDGDGLVDVWKVNQGYQDYVHPDPKSGLPTWVALPGANTLPNPKAPKPDLFVEVDYLSNLNGLAGAYKHSHLPKLDALNAMGEAFARQGINVHFDLGPDVYQGLSQYVIKYPIPLPPAAVGPVAPPPADAGGKQIDEAALVCTDPAQPAPGTLCAFPSFVSNNPASNNLIATSWKGGFKFVQNTANLGDFQPGRDQSYRYALFGHALGKPRSYWSTLASYVAAPAQDKNLDFGIYTLPQLINIVVSKGTGIITLKSPSWIAPGNVTPANQQPLVLKPGDLPGICNAPPPPAPFPPGPPPACGDLNQDRITISGSLTPLLTAPFAPGKDPSNLAFPLNGTYKFSGASSSPDPIVGQGMIITTFNITTSGVPDGTYQFSCDPLNPIVPACVAEPQLGVSYLGPTSSSGHGDVGGADLAVTLGLWGFDDPVDPATGKLLCEPDPSMAPPYCNNEVGTTSEQFAAFLHEFGHTLSLSHGGSYYRDIDHPSLPAYELNCKSNFMSAMNYLYEMRGFVGGGLDYSGQMLSPLNETTQQAMSADGVLVPALSESLGLDTLGVGPTADHLPRWYALAGPADITLQDAALAHCDGSPIGTNEQPLSVRVEGTLRVSPSAPLDWNNDLTIDAIGQVLAAASGEDLNHNGIIGDPPFSGFDDWARINLQQTNARAGGGGFSGGGGPDTFGGGPDTFGGGPDTFGGGPDTFGGGPDTFGGGPDTFGGGIEQDEQSANSSADAPTGLSCTNPEKNSSGVLFPGCTGAGPYSEKAKGIPLSWFAPTFGQTRFYSIWRALGSFPTSQKVLANIASFSKILTLKGSPPSTSIVDQVNLQSGKTYTYIITDTNKFGANSSFSMPIVVNLTF